MAALAQPTPAEMAAAFNPEAPAKRAGLSLVERLDEVELILRTLEGLDEEELGPELREELQRELIAAIAGTREKIDRTAHVLGALENAETAARAEAQRLTLRARRFERQLERLKGSVLATLAASNRTKIEGYTATLSSRLNPIGVVVDKLSDVPLSFRRPGDPNKTAIREAIEAKVDVPGCRLARTTRLVVS
jgi:hypothetical protein